MGERFRGQPRHRVERDPFRPLSCGDLPVLASVAAPNRATTGKIAASAADFIMREFTCLITEMGDLQILPRHSMPAAGFPDRRGYVPTTIAWLPHA